MKPKIKRGTKLHAAAKKAIQIHTLDVATRLIGRHGYEAVTVADIAAVASISRRTFFRHFGSKEDLMFVWVEESGALLLNDIKARVDAMRPDENLRESLMAFARRFDSDRDRMRAVARIYFETPILRGRLYSEILKWEEVWATALAQTPRSSNAKMYRYRTMIACAFAVFVVATRTWASGAGQSTLVTLLSQALDILMEGWDSGSSSTRNSSRSGKKARRAD